MTIEDLPAVTLDALRQRLVDEGQRLLNAPPAQTVAFTGKAAEDALLNDLTDHPHAFVFACLFQRSGKSATAWEVPLRVKQRAGTFAIKDLAKLDAQDWLDITMESPKLHRFPTKMSITLRKATALIMDKYGGDAARIWSDTPSSARLTRRFLEFDGAGPKIATMASNILVRGFRVDVADRRYIDISADTHVVRVMSRLGLVRRSATTDEVIYAARELNPDFPGIFDLPLWELGQSTCSRRGPRCNVCFLQDVCAFSMAAAGRC